MRTYALVNDNSVTSIQILDEQAVVELSRTNDLIVDVEDQFPQPQVGWNLVGNRLEPAIEASQEEREIALAKLKMKNGVMMSEKAIARVGARNKILAKTASQITALLTSLSGVRALLETGALGTARDIITQLKNGYPEYNDIFDETVNEINDFESKYGL